MSQERAKFLPVLAGGAAIVALLIWTQVTDEQSAAEVSDTTRSGGATESSTVPGVESLARDVCTLEISTTTLGGESLAGVEHCAYELLSGRRVGCHRSDQGGMATIEWNCDKRRQIALSSASPEWVAAGTTLVSPAPNNPQTVRVQLARADIYLSGRVEDALGGPIEGALVRIYCRGDDSGIALGFGTTDSDGDFRSGVPRFCEVESVVASAPGYAATNHFVEHDRDGIIVRLFPAGVIRGRVTNNDGTVSNPVVTLRGASGLDGLPPSDRIAKVNGHGEYVFDAVPPGFWVVTASSDGQFGTYPSPIRLELGGTREDVDVNLVDGASLDVVVGEELADRCAGGRLAVVAEGMSRSTVASFEIDEPGTLRSNGLPPQVLVASLKCDGYAAIGSPPLHEIDHRWEPVLPKGASVSGVVLDDAGEPVAGAKVWVKGEQKGAAPSGRSDEAGNFNIFGLIDGPATVFAQTASSPRASAEIVIRDQGVENVVVSLPPSTEARGKVISQGRGVGGYHVVVTASNGSCKTASDDGGAFSCVFASDDRVVDYEVMDHQDRIVGKAQGPIDEDVEIEIETWTLLGTVTAMEDGPFSISADAFVEGRRIPTPIGAATDPTSGRFEIPGLAMGVSYWLTARSAFGNSASAGPFSDGDQASLELQELARLQLAVPCGGERGEMRISRSESSSFALLATPVQVSDDGVIGPFEVPAGEWHVGLRFGAGRSVSAPVTLEPGQTRTLNFETCI